MHIKKRFSILVMLAMLFAVACEPATSNRKGEFCGQMEGFEKLKTDPVFMENRAQLAELTNNYQGFLEKDSDGFRSQVITIPVVFHVVYENDAENISDAQLLSQIDALNEFFRAGNADLSVLPEEFEDLAADAMIEFAIAQRDPDCNPTNGITRTETEVLEFTKSSGAATQEERNPVKFASEGGADGWPSDQYLNFWVCDLSGTLLGYGSWPEFAATRPAEDGMVMDFSTVGTVEAVSAPYDLGRIAAHEICHWLNVYHIWGDESACAGSDEVDDTPNQGDFNRDCPAFPSVSCMNGPDGDLFYNQMDYTDDNCRVMVTTGQTDRMHATIYEVRSSLAGSQGHLPPPGGGIAQDLWMQDTHEDVGDEPNNESSTMYVSEDIWVRRSNDGMTNTEHQNPNGGEKNYVYVRVRNRGCNNAEAAELKLYWAKTGSGLSWPAPWDGSIGAPAQMGNPIDVKNTGVISGNEFEVYEFEWNTPDPADYAVFEADRTHFCLLARLETEGDAPFGMATPETDNLWNNVKNNNNIVWKNVSVDEDGSGFVIVGNNGKNRKKVDLEFDFLRNPRGYMNVIPKAVLEEGIFEIIPGKKLANLLQKLQPQLDGIKDQGNGTYRIQKLQSGIRGITLAPGAQLPLEVRFTPRQKERSKKRKVILLDMLQVETGAPAPMGGQLFKFKY